MKKENILLYGANGYTGRLIAHLNAAYRLPLILAGRNEVALQALAAETGYPYRVAHLSNTGALHALLQDVAVVVHAAGPFAQTAQPMVAACLATGTHYVDINGDINVFEEVQRSNDAAMRQHIMLLPGAGFDVVPTDCIALQLKQQLPDATHLQLAFVTEGGRISHGTATTLLSKLGHGGAERKNGQIVPVPLGAHALWLQVNGKKRLVASIPWGDVSTAWYTTGIPNICTYTGMPPQLYPLLQWQRLFNPILRTQTVRSLLQRRIDAAPAGPTDAERARARTYVWARVRNAAGQTKTASFQCADGYTFTAHSCLQIAQLIVEGRWKPGFQTPAAVYGADFVWKVPGTTAAEVLLLQEHR
ncbi:MAG: saccharopine dehydrogenase family protein [Lacibacter sp.]